MTERVDRAAGALHPSTTSRGSAPVPTHRVLLVGTASFTWLRRLQGRAPGPRTDLRYLVEGAIALLQESEALHTEWFDHSRRALLAHVASRGGTAGSGAGRMSSPADGATARTPGGPAGRERHEDCKALQIRETSFQWLKVKQGTTRDPRLDMRYLVEGVFALLDERADLLPQVVGLARRSLREHLAELEHQTIEPFSLENLQ